MRDIGETIFAALAVVVLCAVIVINNGALLASWMAWAQSSAAVPPSAAASVNGSFFVQNLVGFAVVSAIGGIWLWARRMPQQDSNKPAGVGYRHSRKPRTASDLRKLTEV